MGRIALRRSLVSLGLLVVASFTGACGDPELIGFEAPPAPPMIPDIMARPMALDFGAVRVGDAASLQVRVGNEGDGELQISTLSLSGVGAEDFVLVDDPVSASVLAPGAFADLTLEFRPSAEDRYQVTLEVASDDPDENPLSIHVDGIGVVIEAPIAVCSVLPGTVHVGTEPATFVGSDSFDPNGGSIVSFSWQLTARPQASNQLLPGCSATADCGPFVPDEVGTYEATLTVTNIAGEQGTCTATLEVIPPPEGPVAVCSVTPALVRPPFEPAMFIGSQSHDPTGLPLTYRWRIAGSPMGSAVTLPAGCLNAADCGPFTPDQPGPYTGELTVTNEAGISDTCTATLQAEPADSLYITMHWTFPNDDMDLHLIQGNAAPESTGDCYYGNCNADTGKVLDWGVQNVAEDNPVLQLDEIATTGPENIKIIAPVAGEYTVMVHDYPLSMYLGANNVTVQVSIDGRVVYTDQRTISGEDSYTSFCKISWPSGVVTRL